MPSHLNKDPVFLEEVTEEDKGHWMPMTDDDLEFMFSDQITLPKEYDFDNLGECVDEVMAPYENIATQTEEQKVPSLLLKEE